MSKNVLIIAAHPDDEVLGCGGTMARHVKDGDKVGVIFVADGVGSRNNDFEENLKKRKLSAEKALKILGVECLGSFDFPDNRLDTIPLLEIVQKLEGIIEKFRPSIVYTHHYGDLNIDHSIVHRATLTACRPLPEGIVREIYAYEVLSSTEWALDQESFVPEYYVDISQSFEKKMLALNAYHEELRRFPHPRSLESISSLSSIRGSVVGKTCCEAFKVIRFIR